MSLNYNDLKTLDLYPFEVRGAKPGITNAVTTSILFTTNTYQPGSSLMIGDASYASDSSIVKASAGNNWQIIKAGDTFKGDGTNFIGKVSLVPDATTIVLNTESGIDGSASYRIEMKTRDYLISPDAVANTSTGDATWSQGLPYVGNLSPFPDWLTSIKVGDEIQLGDKIFYRVYTVNSDVILTLTQNYSGATGQGPYTARKVLVNNAFYKYTKDDFVYNLESARWEEKSITASGLPTSDYFKDFTNGIQLKFSHSSLSSNPDMISTDTVGSEGNFKVLTTSTLREIDEYPLPTVPMPEDKFTLYINDNKQTMFEDYVINYHQEPYYLPPPPDSEKKVANLLFLKGVTDQTLITSAPYGTQSTQFFQVRNGRQEPINSLFLNSDSIKLFDGITTTPLTRHINYEPDYVAGLVNTVGTQADEPLVKYVLVERKGLIDDGVRIFRGGVEQQVSFPYQTSDDVIFQPDFGLLRFNKALNPDEEALVFYQVEAKSISEKLIDSATGDETSFWLSTFPIRDGGLVLSKGNIVFEEGVDYRLGCQTGHVVLFSPLSLGDSLNADYIPLSKQFNGMTVQKSNEWTCRVYDEPVKNINTENWQFTIINPNLPNDATVSQVKKNTDSTNDFIYSLEGLTKNGGVVTLQQNAQNLAIGFSSDYDIRVEYHYSNNSIAYVPAMPTRTTLPGRIATDRLDTSSLYIYDSNATSFFPSNSITKLTTSTSSSEFYFLVNSSTYDGKDTVVNFADTFPDDIVNPNIFTSDSVITFLAGPTISSIGTGAAELTVSGYPNIDIRLNTLLKIGNEVHIVSNVVFNPDTTAYTMSIIPEISRDFKDTVLYYSDYPIYPEGVTELNTRKTLLETPSQPAIDISYKGTGTATLSSDATSLYVTEVVGTTQISHIFYYNTHPDIPNMAAAISTDASLSATPYLTWTWNSSKIDPIEDIPIARDTTALVTVSPALRLGGVDTTDFEIRAGQVILDRPLVENQRYNIDYFGGENIPVGYSVIGTTKYFTRLPKGSSISTTFDYDNPDQWYIQAISQKDFLNEVLKTKLEEESAQANGQTGQGVGLTPEVTGNVQGGIEDSEYQKRDIEIECHIYKSIFDYYNNRLQAYADEMQAGNGPILCGADGLLSEADQSSAAKPFFSRVFPRDYTAYPPYPIAALTGQVRGPGYAIFTPGSATVTDAAPYLALFSLRAGPTDWSNQLRPDDFIRPIYDSSNYKILSIPSNSTIILDQTYHGPAYPYRRIEDFGFIATAKYPTFADDGFTGPRLVGNRESNFGLEAGNVFNIHIDGTRKDTTFIPSGNPLIDFMFPLSGFTINQVVNQLNAPPDPSGPNGHDLSGLKASADIVPNPDSVYGSSTAIVLKTMGINPVTGYPYSTLMINGDSSSNYKLGFPPTMDSTGNFDRDAEIFLLPKEEALVAAELTNIGTLLATPNKFSRPLISACNNFYSLLGDETKINLQEIPRITNEVVASTWLALEDKLSTSTDNTNALINNTQFLTDTSNMYVYNNAVLATGVTFSTRQAWIIDKSLGMQDLPVQGLASFVLTVPTVHDYRIVSPLMFPLDTTYLTGPYTGVGLVRNWDILPYTPLYSLDHTATYTFTDSTQRLFGIYKNSGLMTSTTYNIDRTALRLNWVYSGVPGTQDFLFSSYNQIKDLTAAINSITGLATDTSADATNIYYGALLKSSGTITQVVAPGNTLFQGLKGDVRVTYYTVSDKNLDDRSSVANDRTSQLDQRITFLTARDIQIRDFLITESSGAFLNDVQGNPGELYKWAEARFHRRNGCEARLRSRELLETINLDTKRITTNVTSIL